MESKSKKIALFVCIGAAFISSSFLVSQFLHVTDFTFGLLFGLGIGVFVLALSIYRKQFIVK